MIDLALVPQLRQGVRLRYDRHTARFWLLSPERGLILNESAATIARACDGTRPIATMVAELVRAGVPEARARQDVLALLESLRARGLVRLQAAS